MFITEGQEETLHLQTKHTWNKRPLSYMRCVFPSADQTMSLKKATAAVSV